MTGARKQTSIRKMTMIPPAMAILFLRNRSQASCHSELPCSAGSNAGFGASWSEVSIMSFKAHFRIQQHLKDIYHQVEPDDECGVEHHRPHDERIIIVENGLDKKS